MPGTGQPQADLPANAASAAGYHHYARVIHPAKLASRSAYPVPGEGNGDGVGA